MQDTTQENERVWSTDRLLKAREAAVLLGLSVRMIYTLVAIGDLQRVKIGNATRFRLSDIESLMQHGAG